MFWTLDGDDPTTAPPNTGVVTKTLSMAMAPGTDYANAVADRGDGVIVTAGSCSEQTLTSPVVIEGPSASWPCPIAHANPATMLDSAPAPRSITGLATLCDALHYVGLTSDGTVKRGLFGGITWQAQHVEDLSNGAAALTRPSLAASDALFAAFPSGSDTWTIRRLTDPAQETTVTLSQGASTDAIALDATSSGVALSFFTGQGAVTWGSWAPKGVVTAAARLDPDLSFAVGLSTTSAAVLQAAAMNGPSLMVAGRADEMTAELSSSTGSTTAIQGTDSRFFLLDRCWGLP